LFLGGGDLEPGLNTGKWSIGAYSSYNQGTTPTWGGVANEEGWLHNTASTRFTYGAFRVPENFVPGTSSDYDIRASVWWVNNTVVAANWYWQVLFHSYRQISASGLYTNLWHTYDTSTQQVTSSGAVSDVFRTEVRPEYGVLYTNTLRAGDLVVVGVRWYNSGGTENISVLGLELEYTGYTP
jgi:hypothetical protein